MSPSEPTRLLSPADLAAIQTRADAATEGPWTWRRDGDALYLNAGRRGIAAGYYSEADERNYMLLAHAREDVPALLATVRHYQEALEAALDGRLRHRTVGHPTKVEGVVRMACADDCEACAALRLEEQ